MRTRTTAAILAGVGVLSFMVGTAIPGSAERSQEQIALAATSMQDEADTWVSSWSELERIGTAKNRQFMFVADGQPLLDETGRPSSPVVIPARTVDQGTTYLDVTQKGHEVTALRSQTGEANTCANGNVSRLWVEVSIAGSHRWSPTVYVSSCELV